MSRNLEHKYAILQVPYIFFEIKRIAKRNDKQNPILYEHNPNNLNQY